MIEYNTMVTELKDSRDGGVEMVNDWVTPDNNFKDAVKTFISNANTDLKHYDVGLYANEDLLALVEFNGDDIELTLAGHGIESERKTLDKALETIAETFNKSAH